MLTVRVAVTELLRRSVHLRSMAWCCAAKDDDLEAQAQEIIHTRDAEIAKLKAELKNLQARSKSAAVDTPVSDTGPGSPNTKQLQQRKNFQGIEESSTDNELRNESDNQVRR